MTNGANYQRGKLHHSPWHSDIRTSNQLNMMSIFQWLLSDKAKVISVKKYTNKIEVSDVIRVIESAVNAQDESVWTTTIMVHSSMYPTA